MARGGEWLQEEEGASPRLLDTGPTGCTEEEGGGEHPKPGPQWTVRILMTPWVREDSPWGSVGHPCGGQRGEEVVISDYMYEHLRIRQTLQLAL